MAIVFQLPERHRYIYSNVPITPFYYADPFRLPSLGRTDDAI